MKSASFWCWIFLTVRNDTVKRFEFANKIIWLSKFHVIDHGNTTAASLIKLKWETENIQNESFRFNFPWPGQLLPNRPTGGSELSVSTILIHPYSRVISFSRDVDLNEVCKEVCVEETLACITDCDSTDTQCISNCLRAEATCLDRKYLRLSRTHQNLTMFDIDFMK